MFENDQVTDQVERVNHLHMFELSIWIEMEKHTSKIAKKTRYIICERLLCAMRRSRERHRHLE